MYQTSTTAFLPPVLLMSLEEPEINERSDRQIASSYFADFRASLPFKTAEKFRRFNHSIRNHTITHCLPVNFAEYDVNAADGCDDVGDQSSYAHFFQGLQV